jgi:hypothetical protein
MESGSATRSGTLIQRRIKQNSNLTDLPDIGALAGWLSPGPWLPANSIDHLTTRAAKTSGASSASRAPESCAAAASKQQFVYRSSSRRLRA